MGTVSIEQAVLQDMLERLRFLEQASMQPKPKTKPLLATLTTRKPLSTPQTISDATPVFGFWGRYDYDAWLAFTSLAKCFLTQNPAFYMDRTFDNRPYIRSNCADKPRDLRLVATERLQAAAEMLDEMILVYNKHFAEAHKYVKYRPSQSAEAQIIRVNDPKLE